MKFSASTATPLSDEDLLARYLQTQDQAWLAFLYQRYMTLIFGVCLKYLKEDGLASDAVMDIYEGLLKKLPRQQVEKFRPWLYVVAKHHCLMQLRARKGFTTELSEEQLVHLEDDVHPLQAWEKERRLTTLERCVEQLQDRQQQAVRLFYLEQRCYQDIVTATGQDWNTVRSLIQNGRRNLKICMERHEAN